MITRISSLAFSGIDIINVDVQTQISAAMPNFIIVGLADKTIAESKERVRAALSSMGLSLPAKRIVINLSPADLIKEGSHFDLAIACSILANMGVLPEEQINRYLILGELALDGSIVATSGILPAAIGALERSKGLICAMDNGPEAAWSGNKDILAPGNLMELINHFKGTQILSCPEIKLSIDKVKYPDMSDIKGQKSAKRVIEIAAAGGHNLLMFGPPGSGKSMLAERLPGILPELTPKEILECSMIASISGLVKDGQLTTSRPFRAPHYTCTAPAMVGGGASRRVRPGEISLAHNGILFLDELPEFNSSVIESLRQPIETKEVLIARSCTHIKYPANFQLIAAMNPCKCGYLGDSGRECTKAPICGQNYKMKISGPMLDRFDLHIEVSIDENYAYDKMYDVVTEESSSKVKARVENARNLQASRYHGYGIKNNSELDGNLLIEYAIPNDDGKELLNEAAKKFKLSMRSYNRILKVSRTIADLASANHVRKEHIAEALSCRQMQYNRQPVL